MRHSKINYLKQRRRYQSCRHAAFQSMATNMNPHLHFPAGCASVPTAVILETARAAQKVFMPTLRESVHNIATPPSNRRSRPYSVGDLPETRKSISSILTTPANCTTPETMTLKFTSVNTDYENQNVTTSLAANFMTLAQFSIFVSCDGVPLLRDTGPKPAQHTLF